MSATPFRAAFLAGRVLPRVRVAAVAGVLAPALVYLAVRAVGLGVLWWAGDGAPLTDRLFAWDGGWFRTVAVEGYRSSPDRPEGALATLAFFPGYPLLVRAVAAAVPGVGVVGAGLGLNVVAGVALAYGLVALAEAVPGGSRRAGLLLVGLVAASPLGVTLSMAYSEALFCALAVWSLVALLGGRWLAAAALCAAAGLVRNAGAALALAVVVAAVAAAVTGRARGPRPLLAALLAPAGVLGWLGYVAVRTGRPDGWFAVQQQGWHTGFDGGRATWEVVRTAVAETPDLRAVVNSALVVTALVLLAVAAWTWWRTPAWPLAVYGAGIVALAVASASVPMIKGRLLLPAFVLLLPPALALARRWTGSLTAPIAAAAVLSAGYGHYALTFSWGAI